MQERQPDGWSYRLSPRLELRTRPPARTGAEQVLLVRSGQAFPPGHPTTRLCLELLQEALATAKVRCLLDVGCGAGVISLAAAALGVPRVVAVDIAWQAALATRENARENRLTIRTVQGSSECLKQNFDLVVANLPWEVQMDKIAEFNRLAAAGGRLILSGWRDNQESQLRADYQRLGWSVTRRLVKEFYHPELPPEISFTWVAWQLDRGPKTGDR